MSVAYGQANKGKGSAGLDKVEVANFLNKTNKIIRATYRQFTANKVYTGGLAAAKNYQQKAIMEYNSNNLQNSVNNSYTARRLAFNSYLANTKSSSIKSDWQLNNTEKGMVSQKLSDSEIKAKQNGGAIVNEKKSSFNVSSLKDIGSNGRKNKGKGQCDDGKNHKGKGQCDGRNHKGKGQCDGRTHKGKG